MLRRMASLFPYFSEGIVVKGFGRGSKQLGIPTVPRRSAHLIRIPRNTKCVNMVVPVSTLSLLWILMTLGKSHAALYDVGSNPALTISLSQPEGQECFCFPNIRIYNSVGDNLTAALQTESTICVSYNGGVSFKSSTFDISGNGSFNTFDAVPSGDSQQAAILPLYQNYHTETNRLSDPAAGLYYSFTTDSTQLGTFKTDVDDCGFNLGDFDPFWAAVITWKSFVLATHGSPYNSMAAEWNTFQVMLLGNCAELFVMFNYDAVANPVNAKIQGDVGPGKEFTVSGISSTASNCHPVVAGRFVYYVSDDDIIEPAATPTIFDCTGGGSPAPCGEYQAVRGLAAGSSSETCVGGSSCDCLGDYSGIYCLCDAEASCAASPCEASNTDNYWDTGLLVATDDQGRCHCCCSRGWEGLNCSVEADPCDEEPCKNGATCMAEGQFDFRCMCAEGWTGVTCEMDINECTDDPELCKNGGTCVNDPPGSFTCQCTDDWTGITCECGPWSYPTAATCRHTSGPYNVRFRIRCGGCGEWTRTRTCPTTDEMESESVACGERKCRNVKIDKMQYGIRFKGGKRKRVGRESRCCINYDDPSGPDPQYARGAMCRREGWIFP